MAFNKGIVIGLTIILFWAAGLIFLLSLNIARTPLFGIVSAVLLQTLLYTGLFITAHDAMHELVAPKRKRLNNFIGTLCVILYALFSFKRLRIEHHKHHAHPGSEDDPDFHDGEHRGFWAWYFHFMKTYVTWQQIAGMAIAFNVMLHLLKISQLNLALFWIAPALLSTLQLFYFGTYLPHREPAGGYDNSHRAKSNDFSVIWSFLTCYHFGYHWEHHEYPQVPWWKLPKIRKAQMRKKLLTS
ncbi:fatty acid desaturase [candidate division KSB1 bacterium]|nr:fatty acid desaturase [candidate division KSB1 bacterium]